MKNYKYIYWRDPDINSNVYVNYCKVDMSTVYKHNYDLYPKIIHARSLISLTIKKKLQNGNSLWMVLNYYSIFIHLT